MTTITEGHKLLREIIRNSFSDANIYHDQNVIDGIHEVYFYIKKVAYILRLEGNTLIIFDSQIDIHDPNVDPVLWLKNVFSELYD